MRCRTEMCARQTAPSLRFAIYVQRGRELTDRGYLAADGESLAEWAADAQTFPSLRAAQDEMSRKGFVDSTRAPLGKEYPGMAYACRVLA